MLPGLSGGGTSAKPQNLHPLEKKKGGSEKRPSDTRLGIGHTESPPAARASDQLCAHSGLAMLGGSRILSTPKEGSSHRKGEVRTFYIRFPDKASSASPSAQDQASVLLSTFRLPLLAQGWVNLPLLTEKLNFS